MSARDPAFAARQLIFGRVKLCGLRQRQELETAAAATYAGLVFVPDGPRSLSFGDALRLGAKGPKRVGVFRNAELHQVAETAAILGLAAVQLHGEEDADYVRSLCRRISADCEIWKSIAVGKSHPATFDAADRLLFDSGAGGTGRSFDWKLVEGHSRLGSAIVAGGIGPANARAASALGAYAIDVGSAVDERPGLKSPSKIAGLFDALRPQSRQELRICA